MAGPEAAAKKAERAWRFGAIGIVGMLAAVLVAAAIGAAASSGSLEIGRLYKGDLSALQEGLHNITQDLHSFAAGLCSKYNISLPGVLTQLAGNTTAFTDMCKCTKNKRLLSGVVDDCCCDYETVDTVNQEVLQPLLQELVQTPFFRYFKVRLWCDCPFWREDGMCHSRDCSVGECSEDEVPAPLKGGNGGPKKPAAGAPSEQDEGAQVGKGESEALLGKGLLGIQPPEAAAEARESFASVDQTLDKATFHPWVEEDNPWTHDNEAASGDESTYVNLVLNPERYTGYSGDSARRIWQAIYQESCFQDGPNDSCRERRIFYRLISGFHTSITVHVSTSFLHNTLSGEWGPHLEVFKWRVAKFPDRLANLYFTYLFVLRAAMKASDYLSYASYDTGNPAEDKRTAELVDALVHNEQLRSACPMPFDEATMWKGDEGPELLKTLQSHFRNISKIMDCVGCERCRLWGKLEILGLATALKILFSVDGPEKNCPIALQRNEVTALVNTLARFSEALKSVVQMMKILENDFHKGDAFPTDKR